MSDGVPIKTGGCTASASASGEGVIVAPADSDGAWGVSDMASVAGVAVALPSDSDRSPSSSAEEGSNVPSQKAPDTVAEPAVACVLSATQLSAPFTPSRVVKPDG